MFIKKKHSLILITTDQGRILVLNDSLRCAYQRLVLENAFPGQVDLVEDDAAIMKRLAKKQIVSL